MIERELGYCATMKNTHDKLLQSRFVTPLKARVKDFEDVTGELQREWKRKRAEYESNKDATFVHKVYYAIIRFITSRRVFNRKQAYNRYYRACVDYEKEGQKQPQDLAKVKERELKKRETLDEFTMCRKQQNACFDQLEEKRKWILQTTLRVIQQVKLH